LPKPTLSVLLAYYNEVDYLPATLASLLAQRRLPDQLVLVDNGSDDASARLCRELLAQAPFAVVYEHQPVPGTLPALHKGLAAVRGEWTVHCDADTYYPPHYLERIEQLIAEAPPRVNAIMGLSIPGPPESRASKRLIAERLALHRRYPTRCFTGGCAQTFRTRDLREVGGWWTERWPYVLGDHEIVHRLMKRGRSVYDAELWCRASDRRQDQKSVRWTLLERMLYRNLGDRFADWFFYSFLARRFRKRGMSYTNLRKREWAAEASVAS